MWGKKEKILVFVSAVLLTGLFHRHSPGLNLVIFETVFIIWLLVSKQFYFNSHYLIVTGLGLLITSLFTLITHSFFVYIIHFLVLFVFIGLLIYPKTKSLIYSFGFSASNILRSQIQFLNDLSGSKLLGKKMETYIRNFRIFIIPIPIIILFIVIYSSSNPVFDKLVRNTGLFFNDIWMFFFNDFDFSILITFIISLFISIYILVRTTNQKLKDLDTKSGEILLRKKRKVRYFYRIYSLKQEYKSGVILLAILNMVILVLNITDIIWVWFGFEWEGQYLKQFVHEGTYLLILSIIISIILVLYYFRGNLNFYRNNKILQYLSYIWLIQNGILAISVAIRNFWYINYFALAYKRIGVIIFLILTIYGLYTVFVKVRHRKSSFYLFKTNAYALFLVLIISSVFNWDSIIAKYNFKNSNKSFLHLDYLSTLSDNSLPYLDKTLDELKKIDVIQKEKFPFEQKFMTPEEYTTTIENRKRLFIDKWNSKSFLSWNLAEYLAYRKLTRDSQITH
jgi:hypothetical protein